MEAPEGKFSFAPLVSCGSQRRKGIFMTSKWAYRYVTNCKTRVFSFELKPVYFCCFSLGVDFLIPLLPVSSPAYWNVLGPLLRCFFFSFFSKKIQIHDMWSCLFCMCFEKILEIASMSCSCSDISYTLTDLAYLSTFNPQVDTRADDKLNKNMRCCKMLGHIILLKRLQRASTLTIIKYVSGTLLKQCNYTLTDPGVFGWLPIQMLGSKFRYQYISWYWVSHT